MKGNAMTTLDTMNTAGIFPPLSCAATHAADSIRLAIRERT